MERQGSEGEERDEIEFLRAPVTLTFDFLTIKVDRFMSFPGRPLVSICNKIYYLFYKISCSQNW